MPGFFEQFRERVLRSVGGEQPAGRPEGQGDDKIALGVLLWVVAEADKRFLPQERAKIRELLVSAGGIAPEDLPLVMNAVEAAATARVDLYSFTKEVCRGLPYLSRQKIIENLFRVACIDGDLAHEEEETIRKVSGLFRLEHRDFIAAKVKVKKEFGLDTSGL